MNKKRKIRLLLGGILTLALVVTCGVVYQSGVRAHRMRKNLLWRTKRILLTRQ